MARKNNVNNSQRTSRQSRVPSIDYPNVVSIDLLGEMSDDDLFSHLANIREEGTMVRAERCDVTPWEVEFSYADRELQLRRDRRSRHQAYLVSIGENDSSNDDYVNLPSADLDNSEFTSLYELWN